MIPAICFLGLIAMISAVVLYLCSRKFDVKEDPRKNKILNMLPLANCGGCGYPGCAGLAEAIVRAANSGTIDGLFCPVGGSLVMDRIAGVLGLSASAGDPLIAVVRCNGSCSVRPKFVEYSGLRTCAAINSCCFGEVGCGYGCLGCGDCVAACRFDAIHIDSITKLAVVDESRCTACGACAKQCPRHLIELRKKGVHGRRMYVACCNKGKGASVVKACEVSCIGCGKCAKACPFGAISISGNLAYIDPVKCRLCRKCEKECPRNAIVSVNFPVVKKDESKSKIGNNAVSIDKTKEVCL